MANLDPTGWPEAVAWGDGDEAAPFAARARRLGLSFVPAVELGADAIADLAAIRRGSFAASFTGDRLAYLAPDEAAMPGIFRWLAVNPAARARLRVSTPTAIRAALTKLAAGELVDDAVERLARVHPHLSARRVATAGQIVAAFLLAAAVVLAIAVWPITALVAINLAGAIFFFAVSALRFVAAGHAARRSPIDDRPTWRRDGPLPTYTVLVPLRGEAAMVVDLVAALDQLDWPRDRLDVKLILEAADPATVAAARRVVTGAPYEIVIVPEGGPRTKPKALAFALPLARGEFVTVYDAEDRPHPGQLREAYAAFVRSGPDLGCLQAGLVIDNGEANWLSLLFSIEYAALFDGLLPALAALGMPVPLGGTSNHFRRAALEAVGGWDPFNVTEDADLGLRLARFGYRSSTLDTATLEDAPEALLPWLRQRTRWFKGWMQTVLVHTRRPWRLARDLGLRGLLGFLFIGPGMIISSLIYPVHIVTLLAMVTNPLLLWGDGGTFAALVLGIDLFNLVAGYMAMAVLSDRALRLRGRGNDARGLVLLPLYWLLMSLASYRALIELVIRPHHWQKTPHRHRGGPHQTGFSGRRERPHPSVRRPSAAGLHDRRS